MITDNKGTKKPSTWASSLLLKKLYYRHNAEPPMVPHQHTKLVKVLRIHLTVIQKNITVVKDKK